MVILTLAAQRAFAARMLASDPTGDPVYFVDDHFVAYAGARPVAKGWNTNGRHAEAGRDDTLVVMPLVESPQGCSPRVLTRGLV